MLVYPLRGHIVGRANLQQTQLTIILLMTKILVEQTYQRVGGGRLAWEESAKSKIPKFYHSVRRDEDIGRLDVPETINIDVKNK